MGKDSFWFKHDYNARNDEKVLELRSVHGAEAYGVFWMLVESMAETDIGGLKATLIGGLSLGYGVAKDRLLEIIKFCLEIELLFEKEGFYYSKRLLKHKEDRAISAENGKKGAENRWKNRGANGYPNGGGNAEEIRREKKREDNRGVSFDLEKKEVVFSDKSRQRLGTAQLGLLEINELKPKDVYKGLIN